MRSDDDLSAICHIIAPRYGRRFHYTHHKYTENTVLIVNCTGTGISSCRFPGPLLSSPLYPMLQVCHQCISSMLHLCGFPIQDHPNAGLAIFCIRATPGHSNNALSSQLV